MAPSGTSENYALTAISPIDGRYRKKTEELAPFFSEFGLIKYRLNVEILYFEALVNLPLPQLEEVNKEALEGLKQRILKFDLADARRIKEIERTTNHDVKAVEYFVKELMADFGLEAFKEWIHFGLTSQDINNTAGPLSFMEAIKQVYQPLLQELINQLDEMASRYEDVAMLARTHGQPASPTILGKEIRVFIERLEAQKELLFNIPFSAKFGGATGNFNAHDVAYPEVDWPSFANEFLAKMGLKRQQFTTQIEHYDHLAAWFDGFKRINTILVDFCRDVWTYISMDYFKQKIVAGEVGSSTMPHKVNPIDFENAEGNLGMANAIFNHLSQKLPVSRLQRDLTDSTVTRNIGVPLAHTVIAFKSIKKGIQKLELNPSKIDEDLNQNVAVLAEAIQTILRREAYPEPYEVLKKLTRTHAQLSIEKIKEFINGLEIDESVKEELRSLRPENYTGIY